MLLWLVRFRTQCLPEMILQTIIMIDFLLRVTLMLQTLKIWDSRWIFQMICCIRYRYAFVSSLFSSNALIPKAVGEPHRDTLNAMILFKCPAVTLLLLICEFKINCNCFMWCQVFSYLGQTHLCVTAMVCKQWRSVSTREEFWLSLNFENRNITMAQCELFSMYLCS